MGSEVKVIGWWPSPFSKRVEIAFQIKGIDYEYVEDDPYVKKSPDLLRYNPVHKKIPVLLHAGKPVVESVVILEYIDETWKNNPLLPTHPYERAQARFWAKFFDDKLLPTLISAMTGSSEGERERAREEAGELLRLLDEEIEGKKFFGGDEIGLVDIVGKTVAYWTPILFEVAGEKQLTMSQFPAISAWRERLLACPVIRENLPSKEELLPVLQARLVAWQAAAAAAKS